MTSQLPKFTLRIPSELLEKIRDLKENKLVYCYSKSYFVLEEGSWKILKEIRESTLNKGI